MRRLLSLLADHSFLIRIFAERRKMRDDKYIFQNTLSSFPVTRPGSFSTLEVSPPMLRCLLNNHRKFFCRFTCSWHLLFPFYALLRIALKILSWLGLPNPARFSQSRFQSLKRKGSPFSMSRYGCKCDFRYTFYVLYLHIIVLRMLSLMHAFHKESLVVNCVQCLLHLGILERTYELWSLAQMPRPALLNHLTYQLSPC